MQEKHHESNINGRILCALVFFVIVATIFCMVVNAREAARQRQEEQKAEQVRQEKIEAEERAKAKRAESLSLQPGVPVGTLDPDMNEKVVYLTFDDGPSENTGKVLDILEQYNVKATFFITGASEEHRPMIKKAYEAGHTIGLHTFSHNYSEVYSSDEAYFSDLDKIGKVAEEQIGFVPCFIRFPGGSSNLVSAKYNKGIMTRLTKAVQEKGYQYYDWNVDSGDGSGYGKDQIIANAMTDRFSHPMILFHDSDSKAATVEALPQIIEYYQNLGYEFRAIDRDSFVSQHAVFN